jgi:putative SOS response-associated peptidase YedK
MRWRRLPNKENGDNMCGRLDQHDINKRLAELAQTAAVLNRSEAPDRWNVTPGTYWPVIHMEDGVLVADDVFWSYRPAWAAAATSVPPKKKIPIAINAKVEKLLTAYWKPLMRSGRGIVCAAGWYEWTGPKGERQPWHIHHRDHNPLFLLTLANFGTFKVNREEAGFVLVTAGSLGGMVDVHDRRPIAVSADDALRWLDPLVPVEEAEHMARQCMLDAELFSWEPAAALDGANASGSDPSSNLL